MRLLIAKQPLRRLLRGTQLVLVATGISLLAYCGFVLVDAWSFQNGARRQLEQLRTERREATSADRTAPEIPLVTSPATPPENAPPSVSGSLIARIDIPRIGLSAMVIEGTSATNLRRAAGHITGTPLPGQPGNVGISGHRDTFFRPLRNIRPNDVITLTTLLGEYRYRVVSTKIVRPDSLDVLDASRDETLTLVTCYPFYYVGPAPDRFIVRAERVGGTS